MRMLVAILIAVGFLWSDLSWALPERMPVSMDSIRETDYRQLTRRRRRQKRRENKNKPKIAPKSRKPEILIGPGGRGRIEFVSGSSIFGQTTRPGEVRILERKDLKLKSMVKRRTDFQKEIIQTVFHDQP